MPSGAVPSDKRCETARDLRSSNGCTSAESHLFQFLFWLVLPLDEELHRRMWPAASNLTEAAAPKSLEKSVPAGDDAVSNVYRQSRLSMRYILRAREKSSENANVSYISDGAKVGATSLHFAMMGCDGFAWHCQPIVQLLAANTCSRCPHGSHSITF